MAFQPPPGAPGAAPGAPGAPGYPQQGYGAPQPGYGAPQGAPPGYGVPPGGYPQQGYGAPPGAPGGYGAPPAGYPGTVPGYPGAPPGAPHGVPAGGAPLAFFNHVNSHVERNYVLIVDRSGSMGGQRWRQAEEAVCQIAPHICNFDPDGITLYLFDNEHKHFENIKEPNAIKEIFKSNGPRGTTNLAGVLAAAFKEHFEVFHRTGRGTTILVVTDGEPDSKPRVAEEIKQATHKMGFDPELSVSFIQIGEDAAAQRFLKELDDQIKGAKFDIVDTLKASDMKNKSFAEMIALSIND